jgi:hypothetical protein
MSADNKPAYTIIGFTVLAGVAAIVAALVYLGGFGARDTQLLVESYYDHPVSGLSAGSAVNFRGVTVGEVKAIRLAGPHAGDITTADAQRVRMLLALDLRKLGVADRPTDDACRRVIDGFVARGLRATGSSSGITGLSRVELNILDNPPPPATLSWQPRHPLIPPAPSLMEGFSEAATKMMNRLGKMDFMSVWSNLSSVAASAQRLVANADALVESQRSGVASIVRNIDEAAERLRELVQELKTNPSLLLRPADPAALPETARP